MAGEVLERGNVLVWFPEEWRSLDGTVQPFLPGIGLLLAQSRAPVVPAVIEGTFEAMPRNARVPRPHRVVVRFGEPIPAEKLGRLEPDDRDAHKALAAKLRERVAALGAPTSGPERA
ncbi:MAG: 1-acyl-sn-glycerol-3-phosphate acyltransferase [Gammaproteobacteria bacterium]|nr:1-acyl-sn-glycerol-3-phosphate acyltransferase [Gammaproteobacteria bacterium]